MIIDQLEQASLYANLNPRLTVALRALATTDLATATPGRHDLQGGDVYALVQRYETKPRAQGQWEAHRQFIDVQYVVAGAELMGYAPLTSLTVTEPYQQEKDMQWLAGQGDFLTIAAGMFAIFFPADAHQPGLAVNDAPAPVHKIVIKVRV